MSSPNFRRRIIDLESGPFQNRLRNQSELRGRCGIKRTAMTQSVYPEKMADPDPLVGGKFKFS